MITIIYENTTQKKGLKSAWGFSALIEFNGSKILFDTGGDKKKFSYNLGRFKVNPADIDIVVISHKHWDHTSGLPKVLHPGQTVYLLKSFPKYLKKQVVKVGANLVEIVRSREIITKIYTTGALKGKVEEQSLVIDSPKGLIVVTGCSHPGIANIIRFAKQQLKKKVYFVMGGFHLYRTKKAQIQEIVEKMRYLGVAKIAPCHCTGKKAVAVFQKEFKKDFLKVGAGSIIDTNFLGP